MGLPDQSDRQRLQQEIARRRKELGLSVSAAARAARIDRESWNGAESGTRTTLDYIYGRIEAALRWRPGSVEAILTGGESTILGEDEAPPPPRRDLEGELRSIRDDPTMPEGLRRMAALQLETIDALLTAAKRAAEDERAV